VTKTNSKNSISVCLYDLARQQDWETYIQNSDRTVFAHQLGWKSVVEETFKHRSIYIMAYRQRRVVGILPLVLVNSLLFGRFLTTSPFLTFGGIACDDEDVASALVGRAIKIARDHQVTYVELKNDTSYRCLSDTKTGYSTLMLDLSPGGDEIWKSKLRPSARRNVRRAEKAGLRVVEGHEHLDAFVDIYARNMHRLGTPTHSRDFFESILEHFPKTLLLLVQHRNSYIGGTLLVPFRNTILMPWVCGLQEYFDLRPNNLLYWESIVRACDRGFRQLDFGRSKWNSGTFNFKSQYGAQPIQLYYQYLLNTARAVPSVDPENPRFKSVIAVWRKLPLPVVNFLGPYIIRNIP